MLKNHVSIYIPSTYNVNHPIDDITRNKVVRWVSIKLSRSFGGCTSSNVIGGYISSNNQYIQEDITIAKSFHDTTNEIAWNVAQHIARVIKRYLKQESITIENNDGIDFI